MHQIKVVVEEMSAMHDEQLEAVLQGDSETELHLQGRLRQVRDRRAVLLDRLRNHVANHGC